jgi:hypothetical protein
MTRPVRLGLAALGLSALAVALPALLAPHTFFSDFPFVGHWVDRLGDYNRHLVTDAGAFYLAFAVLFAWAAARQVRDTALAVCVAWTVFSAAHLAFHVTHLDGFPAADAVAQTASLAVLTVAPLVLIAALRPSDRRT